MSEFRARTVSTTLQTEIRPIPMKAFRIEIMAAKSGKSKTYRHALRMTLRRLEEAGVEVTSQITASSIATVVSASATGRSATTRAVLALLKVVSNYAIRAGYLAVSPFETISAKEWLEPQVPLEKGRHSPRDLWRVLSHLGREASAAHGRDGWQKSRLYAFTAALAYLGLRLAETIYLRIPDIDFGNQSVSVVSRNPGPRKKYVDRRRRVILPEPLGTILVDWIDIRDRFAPEENTYLFPATRGVEPWTSGMPGQKPLARVREAGLRVGIADLTPDSIRRSILAPWWECMAVDVPAEPILNGTGAQA